MLKAYCKGQVSVYLCIILIGVVGLSAILADISRISAGNTLVKKAVRSAARSSLAEYSTRLRENYGLFALSQEKGSEAEETVRKYLLNNLTAPENSGSLNLYDFKIEELKVTPVFNLSEDEIFKQQLMEYMKFRAPKQVAEGFMDKLKVFRDSGKMSEVYNKKLAIDKLSGRMDKSQQKLKKRIDGEGVKEEKFINGFNKDNCLAEAFSKYVEAYKRYKVLLSEVAGFESEIRQINIELTGVSDTKKENELSDELCDLTTQKGKLLGQSEEVKYNISGLLNEIRQNMTEPYISLNENAAADVSSILESGVKVTEAANELEAFLGESFGLSNPYLSDFLKTLSDDIKKMKKLLLPSEEAQSMLAKFRQNASSAKELSAEFQAISGMLSDRGTVEQEEALRKIYAFIGMYDNKISYDYEKPDKGSIKNDLRSGKAEAVKLFLEEQLFKDKNYISEGIIEEELPSVTKLISASFDTEDKTFLYGGEPCNMKNAAVIEHTVDKTDEAADFGDNIDLYDEEGMFQENTFSFIGSMCSALSGDLKALRDEIYINEYIMGTFKNVVPQIVNGTEVDEDINLHGKPKKTEDTFYDYEIEYILHGNPSQNTNKAMTAGELLLVRFGLDTLHVYTDPKKKELAIATAAAVSGWWTGGAGIPVISNLIMGGWGLGEALIDVKDLLDGKKVPVFKTKADWKLDIGLPADGQKTDSKLAFSYYDYLRLFLLAEDEKSKLGRMEDLIQLNMGKNIPNCKLSGCNTYVRVEAVVSMKYLFAVQSFMPVKVKTDDGRHKYKVLVYEGY